jgi:hypothetical protein
MKMTMKSFRRVCLVLMAIMIMSLPAIIATSPLYAQTSQLVIVLKDGTQKTFSLSDVLRIEFVGTQTPSRIDPTGTWRNSPESTWRFTMGANGRYIAQETGLGNASGPAYFTPSGSFRIDYKTRDGVYTGYFEMRFAPDGRTASGIFRQLTPTQRGQDNVTWTRL